MRNVNVRGENRGEARLSVPCGTHTAGCHHGTMVLCYNASSCADARHRHAPSVLLLCSVRLHVKGLFSARTQLWTRTGMD